MSPLVTPSYSVRVLPGRRAKGEGALPFQRDLAGSTQPARLSDTRENGPAAHPFPPNSPLQ